MALIQCGECGQQISDQATACPHCGAPRVHAQPVAVSSLPQQGGLTYHAMAIIGIALLAVGAAVIYGNRPNPDPLAEISAQPVRPATQDAPGNPAIREAAVQQFRSAEPLMVGKWPRKDEFWITVADTRRNWQPTADGACAWIRARGMQGEFSVWVVEMSALLNKRIEQLAYARCG